MSSIPDAPSGVILHATTLARRIDGRWRGVLVQGPSGAGKSDLALRALVSGWALVADDRTVVWASGNGVFASAPSRLTGLVEARGLGVAPVAVRRTVRLALVLDAADSEPERLPDPATARVLHVALRRIRLRLIEGSTLAKLELALAEAATEL